MAPSFLSSFYSSSYSFNFKWLCPRAVYAPRFDRSVSLVTTTALSARVSPNGWTAEGECRVSPLPFHRLRAPGVDLVIPQRYSGSLAHRDCARDSRVFFTQGFHYLCPRSSPFYSSFIAITRCNYIFNLSTTFFHTSQLWKPSTHLSPLCSRIWSRWKPR